ncbi:hypothetical protein DL96DRAFT_1569304 [Flagelloscypha sp. PMI_526]|nr:hypothetical protein DL96DRAFT_1569304 [Flagelloscypha sp. PMI_526]
MSTLMKIDALMPLLQYDLSGVRNALPYLWEPGGITGVLHLLFLVFLDRSQTDHDVQIRITQLFLTSTSTFSSLYSKRLKRAIRGLEPALLPSSFGFDAVTGKSLSFNGCRSSTTTTSEEDYDEEDGRASQKDIIVLEKRNPVVPDAKTGQASER